MRYNTTYQNFPPTYILKIPFPIIETVFMWNCLLPCVLLTESGKKTIIKTKPMKTIYQYLMLGLILLIPFAKINAQDLTTGDLKITVNDEKGLPMPGAVVYITSGGSHLGGATNLDGNFTFRALNP